MANVADKALFEKILDDRHCLHGLLPMKRAYDRLRPIGGTLSSCPAVHLNCIRDPLYQDACISISDRVLIQVFRWVVFGESPLGAGSY